MNNREFFINNLLQILFFNHFFKIVNLCTPLFIRISSLPPNSRDCAGCSVDAVLHSL